MYNMRDLREWVTLADVLDAHEALDIKAANADKVALARETARYGNSR